MNQAILSNAAPPEPGPTPLDTATLADIRRVIGQQPWLVRLPAMLLGDFRHRREEQFARLAVIGMPLLLLLMVSDYLAGLLLLWNSLQDGDRALWTHLMNVCPVVLLTAFACTRIRALLPSYLVWASLLAGTVITAKLYICMAAVSPRLSQGGIEMAMMMTVVVMLAMRLTVWAATTACLASGVVALGVAVAQHLSIDFAHVISAYFGTIAVCFFVAVLQDRQERLNFLQAVVLSHDAVELARLNRQLEYLSQTDGLSGLANRRHFDAVLNREWERAQREGTAIAVVFADVDHFKNYNDSYGHPAGDECLRQVGLALQSALRRPADMAARYGGEEFVILLPGTDREGAHEVAERALAAVDALRLPHRASGVSCHVTISVGLAALIPGSQMGAEALVNAADTALYAAKHQGRHRIVESPSER